MTLATEASRNVRQEGHALLALLSVLIVIAAVGAVMLLVRVSGSASAADGTAPAVVQAAPSALQEVYYITDSPQASEQILQAEEKAANDAAVEGRAVARSLHIIVIANLRDELRAQKLLLSLNEGTQVIDTRVLKGTQKIEAGPLN